jgi:glycosyltransferase involved in cell wall biosynthesis
MSKHSTPAPLVSVITTVYNRERFLLRCLQSVQDGAFQDYEHIVVDDGSSDSSQTIAKAFSEQSPRVHFHVNESNLGDYPNRNQGASLSRGKYLKYLDADDYQGRWALSVMADAMEMYPEAGLGLMDDGRHLHDQPKLISGQEALERYYTGDSNFLNRSPLNAMIRRSAFQELGGFREEPMTGDFDMWHRLAMHFPVVLFPNQLNLYQHHEDQQTAVHSHDPLTGIRYILTSLRHLDDPDSPMAVDVRHHAKARLYRTLARAILVHIRRGNWSSAKAIRQELGWDWASIVRHAR